MSILGTLIGGLGSLWAASEGLDESRKYANEASNTYKDYMGKAVDATTAGRAALPAAYAPYTAAGADAAATLNRGGYNAAMPTLATPSNYGADSADSWLSKISDYSLRKANQALQGSAIAKGGMGGGLARALSDQSQDYAKQYWNDANAAAMNSANMNFQQGNQNWQNQANWQNQQNQQALAQAGLGLQATSGMQGQNLAYDQQLANLYGTEGGGLAGILNNKGQTAANAWGAMGTTLSGLGQETGNLASNWAAGAGGSAPSAGGGEVMSGNFLSQLWG